MTGRFSRFVIYTAVMLVLAFLNETYEFPEGAYFACLTVLSACWVAEIIIEIRSGRS